MNTKTQQDNSAKACEPDAIIDEALVGLQDCAQDAAEASQEAPEAPAALIKLNDAVITGTETEAGNALLETPVTMMLGEMWEQRDKRNTQDGQWISQTRSWAQWIEGGPGDKNNPAWGLSRHNVSKAKEGPCMVLGSSTENARKAVAMVNMSAMGLDIDSGASREAVVAKIKSLGLFCIVYTSYNNGKRVLQLKRDHVLQKMKIKR
ncbi:MAG: hypothetical protein JWS10_1715, partial [Cypionkella sp.]|uniref:hypothetical protein n=1 Tax=Cypionkella sp. TaxID=2811411 RepID=UPI00260CD17D